MPRRGRNRQTAEELGLDTWKFPDEGALQEDVAASYRARKRGVKLKSVSMVFKFATA